MATTYAYLVDPNKQYMTKSGTVNVNGTLRVYDAATDDIVITYKDFNGTENEASITLDNNGRAIVIADSARAYRLEVYDRYGSLQWTVSPLWCLAAGGGVNVHTTRVISTDGSIDVDQIDVGSTTTYDIGLAPGDSIEYLEWVKCKDENISNGTRYPTYAEGTMETSAGEGLQVGQSRFYHITSTLKVDPTGAGINYDTLSVSLIFNDGAEHELIRRDFDIDNSVNDPTLCEFSYDFACPGDGFIYIKIDGVTNFTQVDSEIQVHRIYSGINAVPGSCASKPWVREYFDFNLSGKVDYSAIEYNQDNEITGISGSAIAAGIDSAFVSSVASSYAESAVSGISAWSGYFSSISSKADSSALSSYQPVSAMSSYATESYVDSAVSGKLDVTASSLFITSLPDDLAYTSDVASAVSGKLDASASSEFYPMTGNPSGFLTAHQSLEGLATEEYVDSSVSGKLDTSAYDSSQFVQTSSMSSYALSSDVSGVIDTVSSNSAAWIGGGGGVEESAVSAIASSYAESAASGKLDISAQVITSTASASIGMGYDPVIKAFNGSAVSAYRAGFAATARLYLISGSSRPISALDTGLSKLSGLMSSKLDESASGMFQPSGSYVSATDMSAYVPFSGLEGEGGKVTGISGSAFKGHEYTGISPVTVDNTADTISVEHRTLCVDSTMNAYNRGSSAVIGVNVAGLDLSSKMDASASSLFYSTSNPSGYLTAHQSLAGYATETYVDSAVSGKLDATAYDSAEFYTTSNPSGFIDAASASAIASAYQVVSSLGTSKNGPNSIVTSINSQSISATYAEMAYRAVRDNTGRTISSLPDSAAVSAIASSYAESAASSKLDTTAQVVTSINKTYPATGGTFISQINETNIFAVTAHSAGDWIGASSKVDQSAYDNLYSAFTALNDLISTYSGWFSDLSSISAKVDNSAIGVIE